MSYRVFDEEARAVYIYNEARISDNVRVVPDCQLGHRLPVRAISAPNNVQALSSIPGKIDEPHLCRKEVLVVASEIYHPCLLHLFSLEIELEFKGIC